MPLLSRWAHAAHEAKPHPMLSRLRSLGSFSPHVQPRGGGVSRAPAALPRARSDGAPERSFSREDAASGGHTVFPARTWDGRCERVDGRCEPAGGEAVRAAGGEAPPRGRPQRPFPAEVNPEP